jgi:hypothetical protein
MGTSWNFLVFTMFMMGDIVVLRRYFHSESNHVPFFELALYSAAAFRPVDCFVAAVPKIDVQTSLRKTLFLTFTVIHFF